MKLFKISFNADTAFFFLYFFISLLYFVNIFSAHWNLENTANFKSLLLNYDGGFTRRGLLGQLATSLSYGFKIDLKIIFFIIFCSINFIFLKYFFYYLKSLKKNFLFFFFVFSPIGFIYPLTNYGNIILGENFIIKDIFIITFFLLFVIFCEKSKNENLKLLIGTVGLIVVTLIYELTIFFYPFFFLAFYVSKKRFINFDYYKIFIVLNILLILISIHYFFYEKYNFEIFYLSIFNKFNILITNDDWWFKYWANKEISKSFVFLYNDFKINYFLRYLFYSHPILFLILYIFNNTKMVIKYLFLACVILSSLIFLIAIDWARFLYIIYIFCLISFLQIYKIKKEKVFENMYLNTFLKKINIKFLNFFVVVYCLTWGLKLTYWQNHYSFSAIKILIKHIIYLNGIIR